jgi:hypothetical protein
MLEYQPLLNNTGGGVMIQANNVTVQFGGRALFERVNVMFTPATAMALSAQTAQVNPPF